MIDELIETNGSIYQTIIPETGQVFRYRLLTLKEYNVFVKIRSIGLMDNFSLSMSAFERCYLGEASILSQNLPAGILISIGELILWLSGDCDQYTLDKDLQKHRAINPSNSVFDYIRAAIITAFPTYTIEDIEGWNREQLLSRFTIAENIIEKQREGYQRLELKREKNTNNNTNQSGKIDFEKENRLIRKHQNPIDLEEAQRKDKLNLQQLKKLSNSRR